VQVIFPTIVSNPRASTELTACQRIRKISVQFVYESERRVYGIGQLQADSLNGLIK